LWESHIIPNTTPLALLIRSGRWCAVTGTPISPGGRSLDGKSMTRRNRCASHRSLLGRRTNMHKFLSQADEQLKKCSLEWFIYGSYAALVWGSANLFYHLGKTAPVDRWEVRGGIPSRLTWVAMIFFTVNAFFVCFMPRPQRPAYVGRLLIVSGIVYAAGLFTWFATMLMRP